MWYVDSNWNYQKRVSVVSLETVLYRSENTLNKYYKSPSKYNHKSLFFTRERLHQTFSLWYVTSSLWQNWFKNCISNKIRLIFKLRLVAAVRNMDKNAKLSERLTFKLQIGFGSKSLALMDSETLRI